MEFADKWAAVVWMCYNQLGRRNVTDEQRTVLIGEAYKAQKMTQGSNNQYIQAKNEKAQNELFQSKNPTATKIAKDFGVARETVKRAEHFVDGLNAAEEVSPGFKTAILSGEVKAPKNAIAEIRKMEPEEKKKAVETIRNPHQVKPNRRKNRPTPQKHHKRRKTKRNGRKFKMKPSLPH